MTMSNLDEITMRLVHYFVTKENYQPVVVNGTQNEIWLENTEKKYSVIRINSNYIHNNEQLDFDIFKTKNVVKQIKKKTLSFNCDALTILLNVGENVNLDKTVKHFDFLQINDVNDLTSSNAFTKIFPDIKEDVMSLDATDDIEFFLHVTNDINEETEKKNKIYDKTFRPKPIIVTYILIAINVLTFLLAFMNIVDANKFYVSASALKAGEIYRVIAAAFMHADVIHIACNMYSLFVLGSQLEQVLGRVKFIVVYLISAIFGSLMSAAVSSITGSNISSVGASGAIFGLMGCLFYFGYHYRLYLGNVLVTQLIPVIILNLGLGFMLPGIDNFAHIGGLVGGLFAGMIVGIEGKTEKSDTINGIIVTVILLGFLCYLLFFR